MKAFYIQLGTTNKLAIDSHLNYILPSPSEIHKYFSPEDDNIRYGFYSIPTTFMPEIASNGGSIIELSPAVCLDESLETWDQEKTEKLADATLALLSRQYDLKVAVKRIRTPRHFQDEMHLYKGAIYGLSPTVGPLGLFGHKTPISGLYLAGQTTYPGFGVTTAVVSGIFSAEALIKNESRKLR